MACGESDPARRFVSQNESAQVQNARLMPGKESWFNPAVRPSIRQQHQMVAPDKAIGTNYRRLEQMMSASHTARLVNCASASDNSEVTITVEVEGGQRLNLQLGSDDALDIARYLLLAQQMRDATRPDRALVLGSAVNLAAAVPYVRPVHAG